MKLNKNQQKILKTIHIIVAILWLSCVIVLTSLVYLSQHIQTGEALYMYTYIYHFIDMNILTPAAILTLLTGIIYSTFTQWGYKKHKWIMYKWVITLFIIMSGTFYLAPLTESVLAIVESKKMLALEDLKYLQSVSILFYAGIVNIFLLSSAAMVAVFKPWKKSLSK